jgi:serine/threonine-protein kinase
MTMVYVPGGEFAMGSTEGDSDERPMHTVALDGFWIDRTEVTNAQYRLCVADGRCDAPAYGDDPDLSRDDLPVARVDWTDAQAYCEWAGAQLPTEAEWEYAARGPEGTNYPWGDSFNSTRLNFCDANCDYLHRAPQYDDGYAKAAPVGSFPAGASWCEALDMAGNVWEWVADRYGEYPSGREDNPTGPSSGAARVMRGGSWSSTALHVRSATRFWFDPELRFVNVGFRCARGSD